MSTIIGLTGGLSTGKTTVSKMFKEIGASVLDADRVAHGLIKKDGKCFSMVLKEFGPGILRGENICRKKLAKEVFADKKKIKKLEEIIHREVRSFFKEEIKKFKKVKGQKVLVLEVPLLFESRMDRLVDFTVVVSSKKNQQVERALNKLKIEREQIQQRLNNQMLLNDKIRLADFIIDNSKSLLNTREQVKGIWQKLTQMEKM